jgi:hypothetical protein
LHYPGQFHGFLNFDSVIAAARDALNRIGASLAHVYAGEQSADRTIEISDRTLSRGLPFPQDIVLDALVGSCLASRSTRQLSSAMARRLSPEFAAVAASMLRPWWIPAAMMRRTMTSYLSATTTRQPTSNRPFPLELSRYPAFRGGGWCWLPRVRNGSLLLREHFAQFEPNDLARAGTWNLIDEVHRERHFVR